MLAIENDRLGEGDRHGWRFEAQPVRRDASHYARQVEKALHYDAGVSLACPCKPHHIYIDFSRQSAFVSKVTAESGMTETDDPSQKPS